jgi:AcrR family transcriptional regulator
VNGVNKAGNTRRLILGAARSLHERKGAEALSMRNIARAVGITAPALYRHFPDKERLLDDLAEEGFTRLEGRLRRALDHGGAIGPLERLMAAYLAFGLEDRSSYELMFLMRRRGIRRFPADLQGDRSPTFSILCETVREEAREGRLRRDDPKEVALTIWILLHGLITMQYVGRFGDDRAEFSALARRSLRRLLRGLARGARGKRSRP